MSVVILWITASFLMVNVLECNGSPYIVPLEVRIDKANDTQRMLISGSNSGLTSCEPNNTIRVTKKLTFRSQNFTETTNKSRIDIMEELRLSLDAVIKLCLKRNTDLGDRFLNDPFDCEPLYSLLKELTEPLNETTVWLIEKHLMCGLAPENKPDKVVIILAVLLALAIVAVIILCIVVYKLYQKQNRLKIAPPPSKGTLKRYDNAYTDSVLTSNENENSVPNISTIEGNGNSEPTVKYTPATEDPNASLPDYTDMTGVTDKSRIVSTKRGKLQTQPSEEEYINVDVPAKLSQKKSQKSRRKTQPAHEEEDYITPYGPGSGTLESVKTLDLDSESDHLLHSNTDQSPNLQTTDSQSREIIYENC